MKGYNDMSDAVAFKEKSFEVVLWYYGNIFRAIAIKVMVLCVVRVKTQIR